MTQSRSKAARGYVRPGWTLENAVGTTWRNQLTLEQRVDVRNSNSPGLPAVSLEGSGTSSLATF